MKRKILSTVVLASLFGALSLPAVDEELMLRSPAGEVNRTKTVPGKTPDSVNRAVKQLPPRIQGEQASTRKATGNTTESFDRSKTGVGGKLGPRPVKKRPVEPTEPAPNPAPAKVAPAKPEPAKPEATKADQATPEPAAAPDAPKPEPAAPEPPATEPTK